MLARVLQRTTHYLNLAGVIAVILAGIAIALACQKYIERHQNTVALMRCFGASMTRIIGVFIVGLLMLCLASIVLGIGFGVALQWTLERLFGGLISFQLPKPDLLASWPAVVIGLMLLLGFASPQLFRLRTVSANRLLRQSQTPLPAQNPLVYGAAMLAVTGILFWQIGDAQLLLVLLVAFSLSIAVMYGLANGLVKGLATITHQFSSTWRMGLLNVVRHRANSVLHITAFGMIFLVVLLLGLLRQDLLSNWQQDLPKTTPNYFAINISANKVSAMRAFLARNEVMAQPLYPIIRGRLRTRNGKPIMNTLTPEQQQERVLYRDINFTYRKALPPANPVISGAWWSEDETKPLVSLEEGVAARLGIKLGDTLGFAIAGRTVSATVTNIRKLNWTSFRPSFFFIFTPAVLNDFSSTYMTSFYLPKERVNVLSQLIRQFPNVTLIDIADIITNIQTIVGHMSLAITYILAFMILIGLLVLVASILANIDQRRHESAILRAQGAVTRQLQILLLSEFITLGALAGFAAALAAIFSNWVLSLWLFAVPIEIALWPLWVAPLVSSVLIAVAGYLGSLPVLLSSPMRLLKTFD